MYYICKHKSCISYHSETYLFSSQIGNSVDLCLLLYYMWYTFYMRYKNKNYQIKETEDASGLTHISITKNGKAVSVKIYMEILQLILQDKVNKGESQ